LTQRFLQLDPGDLATVGSNLHRPECVLCTSDGSLFVSDWGGGVCMIESNGTQRRILARNSPIDLKPNGIALTQDGDFLVANLGDDGGIWRLSPDGVVKPFVTEIDGVQLPPANFVLPDSAGRTWLTVSTRIKPRDRAYRAAVNDGFIAVSDKSGTRVVAENLGYTNEVQVDPSGEWLYVNETFARRTSRMRIKRNGSLGSRETVTEYGHGTFPDGLCFDTAGGFWVVSIVSNRVIRVAPDGSHSLILEDADTDFLNDVETAYQNGTMGRPHLDEIRSNRLKSTSSIAFGGSDRRSSYLGCLLDDRIMRFRAPVAGVEPVHWNWRMR
jgi:sugar lactone lactonase YvrE